MLKYLSDLWARVELHWHVLSVAILAALPEVLNYLGVIDLRPLLANYLPDNYVNLIIGVMPFALMFLKSAITVEPKEDE